MKDLEQQLGLKNTLMKVGVEFSARRKAAFFKEVEQDGKLFSNYFTDIITLKDNQRLIEPMRYRVRPKNSVEEIPTKYNVFNARIDALEARKTWNSIFMRNHGLFAFRYFYEWVEFKGKKKLISFRPKNKEIMWAPCLFDTWTSPDSSISFKSFALITDGPPREIEQMGHDRCPIFLKEEFINDWLSPEKENINEMYEILKQKEEVSYDYEWM